MWILAGALSNAAACYTHLHQYEKAETYYSEAVSVFTDLRDSPDVLFRHCTVVDRGGILTAKLWLDHPDLARRESVHDATRGANSTRRSED